LLIEIIEVKKAYIILAHKNPDQLERLIDRLDDGLSSFFIHIDKSSFMNKGTAIYTKNENIELVPGVVTAWGSFGLVEATLNAMATVRKRSDDFERIILLSGQDYPIKSNDYINEFFSSSEYSVFMDSFLLPNYEKWDLDGGIYRVNKYFFGFSFFNKYAAKTINFLSSYIALLRRVIQNEMQHFYGSQWWTMDMYTLSYVLDYVLNNPGYSKFHKYTFAPDELFFQTILLNSKDEKLSKSILNDNKMFMKWANSSSASPEILRKNDFDEILKSSALFARKFDNNIDLSILKLIDKEILEVTSGNSY